MNPTYDFTGQVALVTGASSGMGLATAQAFAEAGAAVVWPTSTTRRLVRHRRADRLRVSSARCQLRCRQRGPGRGHGRAGGGDLRPPRHDVQQLRALAAASAIGSLWRSSMVEVLMGRNRLAEQLGPSLGWAVRIWDCTNPAPD